ncbi:hypothetical protein chiPu_0022559, partial [Chiloscyllium punctatum]|nr:hypothetical protein [Chiloscyllium punctatum]
MDCGSQSCQDAESAKREAGLEGEGVLNLFDDSTGFQAFAIRWEKKFRFVNS